MKALGKHLAILFGIAVPFALGGGAGAQNAGVGAAFGNSDQPVEIFADQGIEWHQDASAYVARGNARATRGETTVYGETLIAYYRKAPAANTGAANGTSGDLGSGTQIYRVDADRNVRIVSPNGTAYGDHAVYDVDKAILVMTGKNLRLITERETITARDTLEYWQNDNMAVARGNAVAVSEDRKISADILTAYFLKQGETAAPSQAGKPPTAARQTQTQTQAKASPAASKTAGGAKPAPGADSNLDRMYAYGNVVITTPEETARGNRGVYNAHTGIAVLTGSVKITRDQNQLNGEAAEVNLNTNVSRILAGAGNGPNPPVRALIIPEKKSGGAADADSATSAPGGAKP